MFSSLKGRYGLRHNGQPFGYIREGDGDWSRYLSPNTLV